MKTKSDSKLMPAVKSSPQVKDANAELDDAQLGKISGGFLQGGGGSGGTNSGTDDVSSVGVGSVNKTHGGAVKKKALRPIQ